MIRLVLVDDLAPVREVMRFSLEGAGLFEVVGEAATGSEALQRVAELVPDAVVLDVDMPGMSGLEVVQELRLRGDTTPVILCTGEAEIPEELPPGVICRLRKPFRFELLRLALQQAVGS